MPRKRLSKDDLVERIRTGLDTKGWEITKTATRAMLDELVVRHVIIFGYGHGLQRAIIDESQHRTPERLIMAQH